MTAVRQAANRDGTETAVDRLWIDESDFTAGETWRLLRWCQSQGADEFTVDVHDSGQRPGTNRFNHFLRPTAVREHLRNAGDGPRDTTVYRLDANSISALQVLFPSGLFQSPSYGAAEPWAEDPIFYRNGQLMLAIISHEEFGEMRLSKREQELLATIGLRSSFPGDEEPCGEIALCPVTLSVLGYEFPCVTGGPEDWWLRVHVTIEAAPDEFCVYKIFDIAVTALDTWRRQMGAVVAGGAAEATLRTAGAEFSLRTTREGSDPSIRVVVDGRGLGADDSLGRQWECTIQLSEVEAAVRQCEVIVREHAAKLAGRPHASIPNDPERAVRASRRFLLSTQ